MTLERTPEGVIDFNQFKDKKEKEQVEPFFTEPAVITLGNPDAPEEQVNYNLLVNLVRDGKQYLALEAQGGQGEVVLVEATGDENGVFNGVKIIDTEEEYEQIVEIVEKVFASQSETPATDEASGDTDGDN